MSKGEEGSGRSDHNRDLPALGRGLDLELVGSQFPLHLVSDGLESKSMRQDLIPHPAVRFIYPMVV